MPGLKKYFPDIRFSSNKVTPDEMDMYIDYCVIYPGAGASSVGTAASGTATVAKPMVIVDRLLDYPRNLLYSCQGTADVGGTWTVNGVNQFGQTVTETVALGTAAAGTPAAATAGTKVFMSVLSGTFTATSDSVGGVLGRVGVAVGTAAGSVGYFGLPIRIKSTGDVKSITFVKNGAVTALNGGTIASYVGTADHTFQGTQIIAATDIYKVRIKATRNAEYDSALS